MDGYYLQKRGKLMKSTKAFFLLILFLTGCIIFLNWARTHYFSGQITSPITRIITIVIISVGVTIMKLTFTSRGFKLFLILYLSLWLVYWILSFIVTHNIYSNQFGKILLLYRDIIPLFTPLPFIFFWFVDRLFFADEKKEV
jgi:hypothetical protein